MEVFLEILKYCIPALIVFLSVYLIMKKYLDRTYALEVLKFQQNQTKNTLPLKLQAYERLAMLCERISPDQLIYRLNASGMTGKSLQQSCMIAVQKEFEHNISQQIYVSENLWKILSLAKNEVLNNLSNVDAELYNTADAFANKVLKSYRNMPLDPISQAKNALNKEVEIILR